ncbi:hypothetical protein CATMQ487_14760 [Sphaerotilus microaerophilus]|uniref:Uncharacterized protein n=1 Tax=Sphaerotilus microaerophilus TaxID=2914710 RepID=A0ABM7YJB5_9BURK|nr:hypothetical protein CATMQ487_14760 [Sphaerotilus sp. FB-5]
MCSDQPLGWVAVALGAASAAAALVAAAWVVGRVVLRVAMLGLLRGVNTMGGPGGGGAGGPGQPVAGDPGRPRRVERTQVAPVQRALYPVVTARPGPVAPAVQLRFARGSKKPAFSVKKRASWTSADLDGGHRWSLDRNVKTAPMLALLASDNCSYCIGYCIRLGTGG